MKVAILGGTGDLGKGLAFRLKLAGYDVIIGSRSEEKAKKSAEDYNRIVEELGGKADIKGMSNEKAAEISDIAIITIPWKFAFETAEKLKDKLNGKIVISPIVPMEAKKGTFTYIPPKEGSAALKLAKILDGSKIVVAFNNIPAKRFADLNENVNWDVVICSDHEDAKEIVKGIVESIKGLRALDGGSLKNSAFIESITPFLINIAKKNGLRELGIKFL